MFSRTAERCARRTAAEHLDKRVTYGELEARSNTLANFLLSRGASKGALVAILSDDSIAITTAIIAVLKANCVFVPLEPAMPDNRLRVLLAEAAPGWFLIDSKYAGRLAAIAPEANPARVVQLDDARASDAYPAHLLHLDDYADYTSAEKPPASSEPDDMCYLYFTSGSTGRPKGIAGRLKAIDHFINWEIKTLGLEEGVRVSQLITPSFDAFLRDIFVPLCAGGTICVPPTRDTLLDAAQLVRWIDRSGINLIHCVPSLFRSLLNEELRPEDFAALRYVLLSGEPLLPADVRKWTELFGERIRLVNLYGPSETTMTKFFYFVSPADKDAPFVSIGRPMEGAKALVVGENGKACRAGKVGEIYIRTPFRTLGYYKQPELTAEVFVQNPFSSDPTDIVYKTGDLGRVLANGNFEFLGRKDQQVKIRGVRIELKEIENLLRSHEAVKDVAVVDREDTPGEKYLCAYVVPGERVADGELRDFLSSHLPALMIPSAFVEMESLPRTFSGKLDRSALPAPDRSERTRAAHFVAPRTPVEKTVAEIWQQVLGVERVGADDDFFDLGGHSLLITKILSRVNRAFEVELPLRTLFEETTVAALAARVEKAREGARARRVPPLVPIVEAERDYALSFAQRRLWFFDQLEPGSTFYNIPVAVRFAARLDAAVLKRCLDEVLRRHEVLRTSFRAVDGVPVQVVARSLALELPLVDLQDLRADEKEAEARRLGREEAERPFELSRAPLIRARLIRLGETDDVLLVTMHHIVSDNWSINILVRELETLYEAFSAGRPSPLPELPVQYADYAQWQRDWLEGELEQEQVAYWKAQLSDAPAGLELPTDHPRPAVQSFGGARQTLTLPKRLSDELSSLSRREGVSMFMLLLAVFNVLLARYSGQRDICVGTPTAGRNRLEVEGLIGFFVNTLVLRTDLSGAPSFRELLARVREVCLGAYAHQEMPFEKLVEELHPERSLSRMPLFQVMFVFQNASDAQSDGAGRRVALLEDRKTTFDLTLGLAETPDGLVGLLDYSTDLFESETVARMLRHFRVLLEAVVANPSQRLWELPMLTEEESRFLLQECNRTTEEAPTQTLHELFARQVEQTPEGVALIDGEEQLTYRQLNERANKVARHLRRQGVGAESLVGVLVERSTEMIVALLGVLKAGAAYVPLDTSHPAERLRYMIEDASVEVVLTGARVATEACDGLACVRVLGMAAPEMEQESGEDFESGADAYNIAYVIYTSGSTGRPKGVMISHEAVCNTLLWRKRTFALSAADRILQNIPYTFDPSVWQIFGALISGATLVLVEPEGHQDSARLVSQMARQRITITDFAPSMLQVILEQKGLEQCRHLRCVFAGGEALPVNLPPRFYARLDASLFNQYGPTETAIDAAYWQCEREQQHHTVPIGRPIANKQIYLLDAHLQPVPVGVFGELHIGGAGLARGYLRNPELTAEKFIPNPFATRAGERLYRTGDLARRLPDGEIEFLGRIDNQVKIRGHRIELGEVEAALGQHDALRESFVMVREGAGGERRLVAYVVAADATQSPSIGELRGYLKSKLPEYMVPSNFVRLDALPRTSSGKVKREALPAPDGERPDGERVMVAPRTPVEEVLCGIWAELLGIAQAGIEDNFFELGGHSLLATQAVARVREIFSVELPLRKIFESPTVAELAGEVESLITQRHGIEVAPIEPVARQRELPLSFAQQRLWFLDRLHPNTSVYNIPLAVKLTGRLDVAALRAALDEIVRRHEVLRTSFEVVEGEPVAVIHPPLSLSIPVEDLSRLPAAEREAQARARAVSEAQRPFDLTRHPLLRVVVLKLADDEHVALLTMHHIISDGWSLGVLKREVATFYRAFSAGEKSPLPELRVQYADFAHWQRERFAGEILQRQLDYWRRQLSGTLPTLELPTDHPRPSVQTFAGAYQFLQLPATLGEALHALGRREGATLYMTLLAAFKALLGRYTQQEDIIVGTAIANRPQVALEGLLGLFVNTLALRTDLSGAPTFGELLKRVRSVALGAYAHQELPFEMLVRELQPERDVSRSPIFQVMFTLQNAPTGALELPGLVLTDVPFDGGAAQFDLTLSITESAHGLACSLGYNTDLFEGETVARMLAHFRVLLEAVVANPSRRLSELPLLTAEERRFLLQECNATAAPVPPLTLPQLFARQVEQTPDAVALVDMKERLTYAQLNERADKVARRLRRRGVGAESLVGVLVERSAEMVVALLGVLKAGAAYVPLDASYPLERLRYMIEDASVEVVLTAGAAGERLAEMWAKGGLSLLNIDDEEADADGSREAFASRAEMENAAYVLYTSGSTGKPKGVVVTHRALVNLLDSMRRQPGLTADDKLLAVTTLSFDIAGLELFLPLTVGGCVVVASREAAADGALLLQHLEQDGVTAMQATPVTWRLLLEAGWQGTTPLKVLCGGEALPWELARELAARSPSVWNLYGPTETTIWSAASEVKETAGRVSIGRPIQNTQFYVLDARGEPAPIGVYGELHIGGEGLARGYLNRPELTAERFVPHPFSAVPGARLYKTGDLVRYLPSGEVEYFGRCDQQVKVRGYRIELGEVESALDQHPQVAQAVVVVREDEPGNQRLVAYVMAQETSIPVAELRGFIAGRLPEYMLPSAFVFVDKFPLTLNGKIDRRALPAPGHARDESHGTYVAPRDQLERQLAQLWEEILDIRPVGTTDNFFELGGHSFLTLRLIGQIKKRFGRDIALASFFQGATIQHLAAMLREEAEAATATPVVAIQPTGSKSPFFCVHEVTGSVHRYVTLAQHLGLDQPLYALQTPAFENGREPYRNLAEMAADYVKAMRQVQPEGPYRIGGWSFGGVVAFEMAQQLEEAGHEVSLLAMLDSAAPRPGAQATEADDEITLLVGLARLHNVTLSAARLRPLTPQERLDYLLEQVRLVDATASLDLDASQMQAMLDAARINLRAQTLYAPRPYPKRITVFRSEEPLPHDAGDTKFEVYQDPTLGWGALSRQPVEVHSIPGNHFTLFAEPNVQILAARLQSCLQESDSQVLTS
ncbi:MAG TPA: amino acid adenylation domain-containing protein [Pyrinomonadaceae bacterium]|nr:amino acid adenylation domain-containing protein [Pyrinomonadaceae bacterium]